MSKKKTNQKEVRVAGASVLSRNDAIVFSKAAEAYVKKATASRETARKALCELGTH